MRGEVKKEDAARHWGRLTHVVLTVDPEPSLLQITVPRKIGTNTNDGEDFKTHVTYAIKIDRETYTLHLKKHTVTWDSALLGLHLHREQTVTQN